MSPFQKLYMAARHGQMLSWCVEHVRESGEVDAVIRSLWNAATDADGLFMLASTDALWSRALDAFPDLLVGDKLPDADMIRSKLCAPTLDSLRLLQIGGPL